MFVGHSGENLSSTAQTDIPFAHRILFAASAGVASAGVASAGVTHLTASLVLNALPAFPALLAGVARVAADFILSGLCRSGEPEQGNCQ